MSDIWRVESWYARNWSRTDDFEELSEIEMFIEDTINHTDRADEGNYEFRIKKVR